MVLLTGELRCRRCKACGRHSSDFHARRKWRRIKMKHIPRQEYWGFKIFIGWAGLGFSAPGCASMTSSLNASELCTPAQCKLSFYPCTA